MKAASGRQCWQINNLKDSQFGENVAENRTQKLPEKKRDSWVIVSTSRHSKKKNARTIMHVAFVMKYFHIFFEDVIHVNDLS